ncbi:MAG TPA: methionyl-tRNA formyltransferase [Myxococcota bacterium]|jgi:methionyl-tRNA formyltransferase
MSEAMQRLAFFGTPELAAVQLRALLDSKHEVVLVVAQPDRPKGRGQKLEPPPTKALALERGIAVAQPETLKKDTPSGDVFHALFREARIDLAVVAAYGRILPQRILDIPRLPFVNVHGSLLPRWRGAAPIQRCIEAGDRETGVCLMHMVKELDAGDVYARATCPVDDTDDSESLTVKVANLGASLLRENLDALLANALARSPQSSEGVTYAHQLEKAEGKIDFARGKRFVRDHARAMHPWPGAFTSWNGEVLKLFSPRAAHGTAAPGVVLGTADGSLVVGTGDGAVAFLEAQLPNKKRMPITEFVRGRPLAEGTVLGP